MNRGHAPLCRTSGSLPPRPSVFQSPYHAHAHAHAPPAPAPAPMLIHGAPINDFDSCYSSCDDISHPSLSRESSDPSKIDEEGRQMVRYPSQEVVEFATKLGYTVDQLSHVLSTLGLEARMDDVLSELVKMRLPSTSSSSSEVVRPSTSSPPRAASASTSSSTVIPPSYGTSMLYKPDNTLRAVVVDGSNVAMAHGRKEVFSCVGLRECLHYFLERGHPEVLIFIPQYRREQPRSDSPITDQHILHEIERNIIWTPSRNVNGRRVVCHDDRYILRTAELKDAIIVSNDEYRDLTRENPGWRRIVDERLLMFTFVEDKFMPPDDPSGRHGPRIESFLSKVPLVSSNALVCPYARKCTYGNKCKFYHPERANGQHMSVTDRLMKENQQKKKSLGAVKSMQYEMFKNKHAALSRTQSLNVVKQGGEGHVAPESSVMLARAAAVPPHPEQQQQSPWHQTVQRHGSSPLTPVNRHNNVHTTVMMEMSPSSSSPNQPNQHGVIGGQRTQKMMVSSQTHLFAPSTAVWGHSELSVGPLTTGPDVSESLSEVRSRVHFHLCHIFPQNYVESVMAANPEEVNAPVLCELIIRAQKEQLRK